LNPIVPTSQPLSRLIEELQKLPGIGPKSAQRLAYYILRAPKEEAQAIAKENGWTIITPERMARLIRAQGYDPHAITLHRDPWRRL